MFNFNFDRRTMYIIIAVLAVIALITMGADGMLALLMSLPGVIIAMTFHEFAHAFAAYKLGDNTPKYQGRLNINPLSHIDPIGFFMLLVAHIGWGRPVQIDPRNFNGKHSISASEAIVAAAGPIMNFIVAIVFGFILGIITKLNPSIALSSTGDIILSVIQYIIILNIGLGVFNLIPLPPLDGSKILIHFLPYNGKVWLTNNEGLFSIIFLLIWISGAASNIIAPVINFLYTSLMNLIFLIF